jgi:hypothetical protein
MKAQTGSTVIGVYSTVTERSVPESNLTLGSTKRYFETEQFTFTSQANDKPGIIHPYMKLPTDGVVLPS